jgi:hypothetical protein
MVRSASEATQRAPYPATMPLGALPAAIVRTTRLADGLICDTAPALSVTHSDPAANAISAGRSPTGIVTI